MIDEDPKARDFLVQEGFFAVPVTYVDGEPVVSFRPNQLAKLLEV